MGSCNGLGSALLARRRPIHPGQKGWRTWYFEEPARKDSVSGRVVAQCNGESDWRPVVDVGELVSDNCRALDADVESLDAANAELFHVAHIVHLIVLLDDFRA